MRTWLVIAALILAMVAFAAVVAKVSRSMGPQQSQVESQDQAAVRGDLESEGLGVEELRFYPVECRPPDSYSIGGPRRLTHPRDWPMLVPGTRNERTRLLRVEYRLDEGLGRISYRDETFFLNDDHRVLGFCPTRFVRLTH